MASQGLQAQIDGAKLVKYDANNALTLAWFGGHGIHAYTADGQEISFWNTGSFADDHATIQQVEMSMDARISGETEYA